MNSQAPQCSGTVISLRGQTVAMTGKVFVGGEHIKRDILAKTLRTHGAAFRTVLSGQISLVVHGDLSGQIVNNARNQYSQKLIDVIDEDRRGHHVYVVTSEGFSDLLKGSLARCLHDDVRRRASAN